VISIMFHSAGLKELAWRSSYVSEPLDIMREKFEVIRDEGYRTVFMEEAAGYAGRRRDNIAHLTFDDGYLDNWVHLFPLLREFGFRATIFVTGQFIDPRDTVREINPVYPRHHDPTGCCAGFLSFREMKEMENSGLVEIQSHSLTHTWYFSGPKIVDFWHPGAATERGGPVWMLWNRFPERKPFYLLEAAGLENQIPYGTPIYEHGKSLETVRYFPDEADLDGRLIDLVESRGSGFFRHDNWREILMEIVKDYRNENGIQGEYETEQEYNHRVRLELSESKRIIEEGIGHEIKGICWPGGGVNQECIRTAREIGYEYFTIGSKLRGPGKIKQIPGMVPRVASLPRVKIKGRYSGYPSRSDFRNYLRGKNGYPVSEWLFRLGKIRNIFRSYKR